MNYDFSALEYYDDMLVHVFGIFIDKDYEAFASYLANQEEVDAFTSKVIQAYQAARLEIKNNLDRIPEPSQRVAYLKEVEQYLSLHPGFHGTMEDAGTKAMIALTHKREDGAPREFALSSMRALLKRKPDSLSDNELVWLTGLHIVASGAHETWEELKAELNRQMRLNKPLIYSAEVSLEIETRSNGADISFDDLWIDKAFTTQVDWIFERLNLIVYRKKELINIQPKTFRNPGRPFVAVFRLLEMTGIVRGTQESNGRLKVPNSVWSKLFAKRYRVNIPVGTAKYLISERQQNQEFRRDVEQALPIVKEAFPGHKASLILPWNLPVNPTTP